MGPVALKECSEEINLLLVRAKHAVVASFYYQQSASESGESIAIILNSATGRKKTAVLLTKGRYARILYTALIPAVKKKR